MKRLVQVALAATLLAVVAMPASAQVYTGRIDITVNDGTGAALPGVGVTATGTDSKTQVTDVRGEAHFLSLPPGKYVVTATLKGFRDYKNEDVPVGAGVVVPLRIVLTVGGVSAEVAVTAVTPVIDTRKTVTATNVALDEMQKIPSSRDPWVVLQTVPGVTVDRVNVGGAESGQQSNYQAKGASGGDNTWNMDGIPITDMAALGSTPTYYDFDMFQEMNVSTGGADVAIPTPGVSLNFILRSGTNRWRGSGRYYFENKSTQSDNVPTFFLGQLAGYNRIEYLKDFGGEGGGPLVKNRLFVQASAGETHPRLNIFGKDDPAHPLHYGIVANDETILRDYSLKLTGEVNHNTRASFTFFEGNKLKFGRGASALRPDATTENQVGPTKLYKGEVNLTVTSATFVTARYAHLSGGFSLTPRGGLSTPAYRDASNVWHGSYYAYATVRPQDTVSVDGNHFRGSHEFKFGFGYRKAAVTSETTWPGGGIISLHTALPLMNVEIVRQHHTDTSAIYMNGYVGDTFTHDRMTINAGIRWDRQAASLNVVTDPLNSNDPQGLLPQISGAAAKNAVVWNSVLPRIGITYALDDSRKTVIRGSYAMFASQLNATQAAVLGTVQYSYTYYYDVVDANGNGVADASEIKPANYGYAVGFDDTNPSALSTPNKIGKYKTPRTQEAIVGFEHELMRNFGVGVSYIYRTFTNFNWYHFDGIDGSDYVQGGTYTCATGEVGVVGSCSVPFFKLAPGITVPAGKTYESRPGYHQKYWGVEVNATKRMSHNWMARLGWTTNRHREFFDNAAARADPTPVVAPTTACGACGPNINGGIVMTKTSGSGKSNVFIVLPKYQFVFNAAYQMKFGITTGINYLFRTGYAEPYFHSNVATGDKPTSNKSVLLVQGTTDYVLDAVHSLDARIGKNLKLNKCDINFDLDVFNLLNLSPVLGRQYDLRVTTANQALEIMNPRIIRFGVRISY